MATSGATTSDEAIHSTMSPADLAVALRSSYADANRLRRAAVEILCEFGGHNDLLRFTAVRQALRRDRDGGVQVLWNELRRQVEDDQSMGDTAYNAIVIACALANDTDMPKLGTALINFDLTNKDVLLRAFGIVLSPEVSDEASESREGEPV